MNISSQPSSDVQEIEALLHTYCQGKIEDSRTMGGGIVELWTTIDDYIRGGGKRLRPRIFLMTYGFYGGSDTSSALQPACAWELLHASLLIHDDIIDRDMIRHGKPNIAGKYYQKYAALTAGDAGHYALSAALLAGDLLIASAYDIINESGLSDAQKIAMQRYLQRAIFAVGGGELIDTESALYPIGSVDPYAVATYKTASYSFQLPMESGAMLADAPIEELEKLSEIGRHVGIAFQLKDDLLGVFGDSQTTGKSNRSDLTEKKRTLLVQQAITHASPEEKERLHELYASQTALTDEQAEEVFAIILRTSAREAVESLVTSNTQAALALVDTLAISRESKDTLSGLISSLLDRQT